MFIREIKKTFKNKRGEYEYIQHRLVESIRTKNGPRQQTILKLNIPREKHKALANLIEANLTNDSQKNMFKESSEIIGLAKHFSDVIIQKRLQNKPLKQEQQSRPFSQYIKKIDVNTITNSNGRTIGGEHIALTYLKQLGFFDILKECSFNKKEQQYAASQICARMVHPSSERETARHEDETFLLCKSPERTAKEEAMFSRRLEKFKKGLISLNQGLQKPRTRKGYASICERIGRLKERHKVGNFFNIDVKQKNDKATEIIWKFDDSKRKEPGEYIIRTSRNDLEDSAVSLIHRTLTMIESAFRWLKSDLGLRPNYHQNDKRMMAHVTISVLAYFVLAPILNKLEWGGLFVGNSEKREDHSPWDVPYGWRGVIEAMESQTRVTTSFLCDDNKRMDVRTTLEPTAKQCDIYNRLKVNPKPLKRIIFKEEKNVVPKKS